MTVEEELERLLKIHRHYYDVDSRGEGPFCASATFHSHDSHYFLTKRAPIGEAETHEYVYFATEKTLNLEKAKDLIDQAWQMGLKHVTPSENHRNSDVILIILAERITDEAIKYIQKCKLSKNYSFLFEGWSVFKVIALETSTDKLISNRRGRDLKKLFKR